MPSALRIVVGVTGGIAAYKALGVIRAFVQDGHDVTVIATKSALNFVGKASLEALSRNPVSVGLYDDVAEVRHVSLGQQADLVVVAPATAHTLASMAAGLAPDLLGNVLLATTGHVVVAPAMHTEMWLHAATQANVATLRARGVTLIGPDTGALTGSDVGPGRMAEPSDIVATCYSVCASHGRRDFAGKHVLISGGGTREPLDPVRYIGNRSSGRQAVALARAALARGASVTLVAAHVDVDLPTGVTHVSAPTSREMLERMTELAPSADIVFMAAAVSDYRAVEIESTKITKRENGARLSLALEQTEDVLATISRMPERKNLIVGFAAETLAGPQLERAAREKLSKKGCDVLVANTVSWDKGFESRDNSVVIVQKGDPSAIEATGDKLTVAHRILDVLI